LPPNKKENEKMKKTTYISKMSQAEQSEIMFDVARKLPIMSKAETELALRNAMDSRLCDLADLIDISKYLK
jgi:hypothetical protein